MATPLSRPETRGPAGVAKYAAQGYRRLRDQIRDCEARWSDDCRRVASEECDAGRVSLVGISGPLRNAQLLYGDMCFVGYGIPKDTEEAARWWTEAADAGSHAAGQRLTVLGVFEALQR